MEPPNIEAINEYVSRRARTVMEVREGIKEKRKKILDKKLLINLLIIISSGFFYSSQPWLGKYHGIIVIIGIMFLIRMINSMINEYLQSAIDNVKQKARIRDYEHCFKYKK